ncbi:MAG: hypothetical protein NTZ46_10475 [Verrucomicrobia bacterium]|nr:hypothetical protein [Verrucomicrobiota bacterium]
MNHRTVSTELSFGQLFLFQPKAPQRPALYRPYKKRKRILRLSLKIAALSGVLLGFGASVLLQIFWLLSR